MRVIFSMTIAAVLTFAGLSARADDCRLKLAASLPMTIDSTGRITVPMSVGTQSVQLLIDTGSPASFLTKAAAQKLGLTIGHNYGQVVGTFYGGYEVRDFTRAINVSLAQMKADSMPFGIMPAPMPSDEDGILGQDVLRAYDLDFDFAGGKLNFYSTDHCAGVVAYWTSDPVAVVPFTRDNSGHIRVDVELDGKGLEAIFDTGASRTRAFWEVLSSEFGLTADSPGVTKLSGTAGGTIYGYPFKELTFGGITVKHPDVTMATVGISKMQQNLPPLLVGINVMRQFHLYIANAERKLYITPASAH